MVDAATAMGLLSVPLPVGVSFAGDGAGFGASAPALGAVGTADAVGVGAGDAVGAGSAVGAADTVGVGDGDAVGAGSAVGAADTVGAKGAALCTLTTLAGFARDGAAILTPIIKANICSNVFACAIWNAAFSTGVLVRPNRWVNPISALVSNFLSLSFSLRAKIVGRFCIAASI